MGEITAEQMAAFEKWQASQDKRAVYNLRRRIKAELSQRKAMQAGITVTEDEVTAEIEARG